MEGSMSIDASSKGAVAPGLGRMPAHLVGFLGANLICAAAFIWGARLLDFWRGGTGALSSVARLLAPTVGMAGGALCLAVGVALLVAGARLLARHPAR
jgi:hypothetical protein